MISGNMQYGCRFSFVLLTSTQACDPAHKSSYMLMWTEQYRPASSFSSLRTGLSSQKVTNRDI